MFAAAVAGGMHHCRVIMQLAIDQQAQEECQDTWALRLRVACHSYVVGQDSITTQGAYGSKIGLSP